MTESSDRHEVEGGRGKEGHGGGALTPVEGLEGLSPRDLMGLARGGSDDDDQETRVSVSNMGESVGRFVPPSVEDLGEYFPQLEILELLGHGGMGAVYRARQTQLDREVALKILPPDLGNGGRGRDFAARFSREARALARLNHPNIVSVYDFGRSGDYFYFVMEYVDGTNLRHLITTGGLEPEEALGVVPQLCDALQFAHDEGVVHRDIKPENILLDKRGRVKIADFGLAKLVDPKGDAAVTEMGLTQEGHVMGTARYMAPEQASSKRGVDHRADIFSLGVVFYEMLTGELPIGKFAPPSSKVSVDVRLDEIVLKALEQEPEMRYQQVSEVRVEVDALRGISPQFVQKMKGMDYKTETTLFGWPLVHIATGVEPSTGKRRVAKGIFAFGDQAVGVFAVGGVGMGVFAFGGIGIGLLGFGGFALGLILASGGIAIGPLAWGGLAIGVVAIGGVAVGAYAAGGAAYGMHVTGGNAGNATGREFFAGWGYTAMMVMIVWNLILPVLAFGFSFLMMGWFKRRERLEV